ncbi:MAG TPA: metal-dependent hydrolase [Longimicrobiales bacterium]|nr:metal-dependent hydrolase [Longimicrobiales bacterium]
MFLGHYGIAFGAKRAAPRASLGVLAFAAQFLDELWPILLLLGVEQVRIVPGLMAASPLDLAHYPFSHSLATAAVWGLLIGLAYLAVRRYGRGGWVVGAAVLSHWFLDLPMHRPDLPLWPGSATRVGLGVWNSVPATIVVEGLVFGIGLALYVRATRAADRIGRWGLWSMVALLLFFFVSSFAGSPPNEHVLAWTALGLWLFVPWSWWVDRHRVARVAVAGAGSDAGSRAGASRPARSQAR